MMISVITKTPVSRVKHDTCPHCEELLDDMTYEDGETVTLNPHPANADTALLWGRCENCFNIVYMLDLAIIPKQDSGSFFNDYCWVAEEPELYNIQIPGYSWPINLSIYLDVSGVMLTENAGKEMYEISVSQLDIYQASGWPAHDFADAFDRARALAGTILSTRTPSESRS